jgi:hypothetical protein
MSRLTGTSTLPSVEAILNKTRGRKDRKQVGFLQLLIGVCAEAVLRTEGLHSIAINGGIASPQSWWPKARAGMTLNSQMNPKHKNGIWKRGLQLREFSDSSRRQI